MWTESVIAIKVARKLKIPVGKWIFCYIIGAGFIAIGVYGSIKLAGNPQPNIRGDEYFPLIAMGFILWITARWKYWRKVKPILIYLKEKYELIKSR